jgi:hypothetical protein
MKAQGPVKTGKAGSGPRLSICEAAEKARLRNSPAAPGLEAKCAAATNAASDTAGDGQADTAGKRKPLRQKMKRALGEAKRHFAGKAIALPVRKEWLQKMTVKPRSRVRIRISGQAALQGSKLLLLQAIGPRGAALACNNPTLFSYKVGEFVLGHLTYGQVRVMSALPPITDVGQRYQISIWLSVCEYTA